MAPKYIAAVSDALITFNTADEAVRHGEGCRSARPLVIYRVEAVGVVHPIKGLTNDDFTPPEGGTPIQVRMVA